MSTFIYKVRCVGAERVLWVSPQPNVFYKFVVVKEEDAYFTSRGSNSFELVSEDEGLFEVGKVYKVLLEEE